MPNTKYTVAHSRIIQDRNKINPPVIIALFFASTLTLELQTYCIFAIRQIMAQLNTPQKTGKLIVSLI
jgi:hypothetical protein